MRKVPAIGVKASLMLALLLSVGHCWASIWQDRALSAKGLGVPFPARALVADQAALKQALAAAPLEETTSQGAELELPMPDGTLQRFEVENSPIMAPELAARYPDIQTYRVKGIDDPAAGGRLDLTPAGFHAMLTTPQGTVFIDSDGNGTYLSYYTRDYQLAAKGLADGPAAATCLLDEGQQTAQRPMLDYALRTSGSRRVYRLAVAATGEYTAFHGGTVDLALAAVVTAINRVNQIYGRDLAIQFVLVANNDKIIYTDAATDPYTNDNGTLMLTENQDNLDRVIGSANYDVGHVFSTGGGGIAGVGVGCRAGVKAQGVTGRPEELGGPVEDIFYIDLVAHELGHQLAAVHSFNGTTNICASGRIAESAVEPGSGSTIMAYAGLCMDDSGGDENLQTSSDAVFHAKSMQEIVAYTSTGDGASCGTFVETTNTAPSVSAGSDYTIPVGTPFVLRGNASDADGDALSYQWDEMDPGGDLYETDAASFGTDIRGNPLFRSFMPITTPVRVLPRLSNLLAGVDDKAEVLPIFSRNMNFRLTARDGKSGVGEDDMQIEVFDTGQAFSVIDSINTSLNSGQQITLAWNVAGTDTPPISCTIVDIHLLTFNFDKSSYCEYPITQTVNDASESITIPSGLGTTRGRLRVKCSTNLFFDINDNDLTINDPVPADASCISTDGTLLLQGTVFNDAGEALGTTPPPDDGGGGGGLSWLTLLLGSVWLAGRALLGRAGRLP